MNQQQLRSALIWWLYACAAGHFLVGALLPLLADSPLLENYHRSVEAGFWLPAAPLAARAQQVWWISLFGPTVQCLALFMGALIYLGDKYRASPAWAWLLIGLLLWAPQDMLISQQNHMALHLWVDTLALLVMLPPLLWLWQHDRRILPPDAGNSA